MAEPSFSLSSNIIVKKRQKVNDPIITNTYNAIQSPIQLSIIYSILKIQYILSHIFTKVKNFVDFLKIIDIMILIFNTKELKMKINKFCKCGGQLEYVKKSDNIIGDTIHDLMIDCICEKCKTISQPKFNYKIKVVDHLNDQMFRHNTNIRFYHECIVHCYEQYYGCLQHIKDSDKEIGCENCMLFSVTDISCQVIMDVKPEEAGDFNAE
jgi:hypothetical protein